MLFNNFEKYIEEKKGVLHVGAHVGEERLWYRKYKFDRVMWFEPDKTSFKLLQKNINDYKKHIAFNFGIHDELKETKLHIANNGGQSSSILDLGTHKESYPDVKYIGEQDIVLMRMDDFFKKYDWDIAEFNFLNIDVQGVELNVIKSFGDLIKSLDYIYTEVNIKEVYKGCSLLPDMDEYLNKHGFYRVLIHITHAGWGDAFYKRY